MKATILVVDDDEDASSLLRDVLERRGYHAVAVSSVAEQLLIQYDWPGNVRELENCVERAVAIARGPILEAADLPEKISRPASSTPL